MFLARTCALTCLSEASELFLFKLLDGCNTSKGQKGASFISEPSLLHLKRLYWVGDTTLSLRLWALAVPSSANQRVVTVLNIVWLPCCSNTMRFKLNISQETSFCQLLLWKYNLVYACSFNLGLLYTWNLLDVTAFSTLVHFKDSIALLRVSRCLGPEEFGCFQYICSCKGGIFKPVAVLKCYCTWCGVVCCAR